MDQLDITNYCIAIGEKEKEFFEDLALEFGFSTIYLSYADYGPQTRRMYCVFNSFIGGHTYIRIGGRSLYKLADIRWSLIAKLRMEDRL